MTDDAWNVGSSTSDHRPSQETRPPHETKLLHELIIQAVTERRVDVDLNLDYDKQLETVIKSIRSSDGYKALLAQNDLRQSDVSALLDHQHLERLPTVDSAHHVTLMMATGGPATGKSSIIKSMKQAYPTTYRDAAKINPDDYKPLLADRDIYGKAYADVSHAESSKLAADIMVRLEEKMAAGNAPHIVMDVVATSEHRMNFAKQAGQLVVVTGTAPLEVTVPRAHERGLPEDGRRIPTKVVIEGARNVAVELPRVFEHPAVMFEVVDTNVPYGASSKPVAHFDKRTSTLKIMNPDTFIDLVERQNINVNAHSPAELFVPQDRTPQRIAEGLKAYTDKGVTLAMLNPQGEVAVVMSNNGVEQVRPLTSARGSSFLPELVVAARIAIAQGASHKTAPNEEVHANTAHEPDPKRPAKEPQFNWRGAGAVPNGIGFGLGMKGIYDDLANDNSPLKRDLDAGGAQAVVGGGRFAAQTADVVIGGAAAVNGTYQALNRGSDAVVGAANAFRDASPAMKWAGRVALPLAVGAGALDATAGVIEHNPERVASAVGRTGGGIGGGILFGMAAGAAWGAAGGSPTGPGALLTAGGGALVGAVVGGYIGEDAAKEYLTSATDKVMHTFGAEKPPILSQQPAAAHPPLAPQPQAATASQFSPDMMRALDAAKGACLSASIMCDKQPVPIQPHGLPSTVMQNGAVVGR